MTIARIFAIGILACYLLAIFLSLLFPIVRNWLASTGEYGIGAIIGSFFVLIILVLYLQFGPDNPDGG